MYDIIVCGSNSVDVFAKTDAEIIKFSGIAHGLPVNERLVAYPLGTKILMKELAFHTGGGGTNVLETFSKQGLKCAYIGKIGQDTNGHVIFEWLKEKKIDFVGQVGGRNGYSIILDSQADDRTILIFKGANNELDFSKLPKHKFMTKWFYGSSMLDKSYETLEKLFVFMKNHGAKTAFNPANYVLQKGLEHIKTILNHTDIFMLNKEEAELLVGEGEPAHLAAQLMEHGPSVVVVTDGERGATIHVNKKWEGKEEAWHIQPAKQLKIVETTGAGDSFASGFVAGVIQGRPFHECARVAILNAEGVIQAYGAKKYIATRKEMDNMLSEEKKNPKHACLDVSLK